MTAIGTRSLAPDFLDGDPEIRPRCDGADPERFFTASEAEAQRVAAAYCGPCPLYWPCRGWALRQTNDLHGVWGGTTQAQRKRLRRQGRS
ncbi:WhiB family transcriptional regulator [Micromonospora sp. NPDC048999]|uniref:WhiB family transcriptional regulator n=1 Tax=Micromonospora sp. NPDC048999 TaxID=3155391 RepID=UPI0033FFBAD0